MNERYGSRDLPGGPVAKTPCSQCRGPGFNPWSGNWIPHAATKSLPATVKVEEPAATETLNSQINIVLFLKKIQFHWGPLSQYHLLSNFPSPHWSAGLLSLSLYFSYPHEMYSRISTSSPDPTGLWSSHQQPHSLCSCGYTSFNC